MGSTDAVGGMAKRGLRTGCAGGMGGGDKHGVWAGWKVSEGMRGGVAVSGPLVMRMMKMRDAMPMRVVRLEGSGGQYYLSYYDMDEHSGELHDHGNPVEHAG